MAPTRSHLHRQLHDNLRDSPRVLLATHERADGDALGSLIALQEHFRRGGTSVLALAPDSSPKIFSFLSGIDSLRTDVSGIDVSAFDAVLLLDSGDVRRTQLAEKLYFLGTQRPLVALIDHHRPALSWRDRNLVDLAIVDTARSSTCELVYEFFVANGLDFSPEQATALLTGIITDTGGFVNAGTTLESMDIAAELLRRGGNLRRIVSATVRSKSVASLQLWGRALSRLERDPATDTISTALMLKDFDECGVDREGSEGIANFLNSLGEGRVVLVLREEPDGLVKGSYRTKRSGVDVAALARVYGGGGHTKAAGFTVAGEIVQDERGWRVREKARTKI
ncbi:MAG: DHH family phosphoesterase [Candidatus Kerfeldbacteria bacterium]|nr:DHH family phosphoesterase [Candidatus Kerfeldbacteria bacterium]